MLAQLTGTNGPSARGLSRCSASAASSLPVPDSPLSSTVLATGALRRSASCSAAICGELPISASAGAWCCDRLRRSTQFSRLSCERSSPCCTAFRICVSRNGFRMKSDAPARSASMAVFRSAKAVTSTTSPAKPCSRRSRSHSMPDRPGRVMSRMTRSKRCRRTSVSASSALPAAWISAQRGASALVRKLRMPGSSSTTSSAACGHSRSRGSRFGGGVGHGTDRRAGCSARG